MTNPTPPAPPSEVALLPCPFCGESARLERVTDGVTEWIVCRKCGCDGPVARNAEQRILAWNGRAAVAKPSLDLVERVARAIDACCAEGVSRDWEWWRNEAEAAIAAMQPEGWVPKTIVPPANGETDPEWRMIRRAIDQFAGRVPTITKHRAVHNEHLRQIVERLDAAGDREAADTIVWQAWFRALDRERERFLLADAAAPIAAATSGGEGGHG